MRDRDVATVRRIALVLILIVTAIPTGLHSPRIAHPQLRLFPVDFILNIVLYLPFGFGLGNRSLVAAIGQGAILSSLVEGLQTFYRGRSAMILDVAANTVGTVIGALLFRIAQRRISPQRVISRNHRTVRI